MRNKLTIILGMVLLVGLVAAANTLSNLEGITIPVSPVIAGNTFSANFNFDYLADGINEDNLPLIIKLNLTSGDQTDYPVWRGDFEIDGFVKRSYLFGLFIKEIPFNCSEESPQTINYVVGSEIVSPENGTFYCYNEEGNLELDRHDNIFLNIKSHPALWPGQYNLTASLYYLNDTYSPIVQILNKANFENVYYKSGNNIEVKADINDLYLDETFGKIYWNGNETFLYEVIKEGVYYYSKTIPEEIPEGNYIIKISAKDESENMGMDETVLLIDETAPEIELVEPTGLVSEEFFVKFNVTDEKAGVNNESVQVRLREIVNGQICPETGGSIGNFSCTTTEWINLELNQTSDLFEVKINTTELNLTSGEYWLDARAEDMLGNKAEWIADEK